MYKRKKELTTIKLEFLALYEAGYRTNSISSMLHIDRSTCQSWCYLISIFGKDIFLTADSTKMKYSYETKLSAVKDFLEEGLSRREVMAKYGIVSIAALKSWKSLYEAGGPEALKPKPKGRPKNKSETDLSTEEKLLKRIEELEIENAIIKKVIALKCSKR